MLTQSANLVVGIGNSLRGDDGVGLQVVERLQASHASLATFRLVRQLLPEMAEEFSFAERIVFVDAAVDLSPGEVKSQRLDGAGRKVEINHNFDPLQLLSLMQLLFERSPSAWCVRIGVLRMEMNQPLSSPVAAAIESAAKEILNLLSPHTAVRHA